MKMLHLQWTRILHSKAFRFFFLDALHFVLLKLQKNDSLQTLTLLLFHAIQIPDLPIEKKKI